MSRKRFVSSVALGTIVAVAAIGPMPAVAGSKDARTVFVAGDIASGDAVSGHAETADLIANRKGLVVTTGDNAYEDGTLAEFMTHYDPTWGRFLGRTRPTPGNHEWNTPGAAGYFAYYGDRAGPAGRGYYSFKVGKWLVLALDSEACVRPVGCGKGSPQYEWLKRKLASTRTRCQMAAFHRPPYSSGRYGTDDSVRPLVKLLYRGGAEIIVNGHEHHYERMAPTRPDGSVARKFGVRQFIVGTGGRRLRPDVVDEAPASRVFDGETWGVLRLRLRPKGYAWRFVPIPGETFTDSGSGSCHGKPK